MKKSLTTFFGKYIDKLSYDELALYIFRVIFTCALLYRFLNLIDEGTSDKDLNILSALYFSIITFSSLGYGDICPMGLGRLVASIEVLLGLIMMAIFIGKIASEKQAIMMRLVYTSEHQKRIVKFEKQIYKLVRKIDKELDNHNHQKLYDLSQKNYRFIASIHNYLKFQSNQADLAAFGNSTALKRLYKSMIDLQLILSDTVKTYGVQPQTKTKTLQVINRISIISYMMAQFHESDVKMIGILNHTQNIENELKQWLIKFENGNVKYKYRNEITEKLLERVFEKIPPKPWPRHIHKIIAFQLEIQNSLAESCITKLISEGKI